MPHEGGYRRNFENNFFTGAFDGNLFAYTVAADYRTSTAGRRHAAADWCSDGRGYAADDGTHAAATAAGRSELEDRQGLTTLSVSLPAQGREVMSGGAHCLCYRLLPRPAAMARLAPSLRTGCWLLLHHHHPPRTGAAQTRTSFISDLLDWFYILMETFMHA